MDTTRLKYFATMARFGSVTQAARSLNVTPAAVSKSVRTLERELGFELVIPEGRSLRVTDRGRRVAERAERLLADFETLYDPDALDGRVDMSFRLGACAWFASWFYGELMHRHIPHCDVALFDAAPEQLEHALAASILDVVITTSPMVRPDVVYERVGRMPMGIFARQQLLDSFAPADMPFAVQGTTSVAGDAPVGADFWPLPPLSRNVKYRVGSTGAAFELCHRGLAALHMPVFVAALYNREAKHSRRLVRVDFPRVAGAGRRVDLFVARRAADVDRHRVEKVSGALAAVCCELEV